MKTGNLLDLGLREYNQVWDLQRSLIVQRFNHQIPDTLILVEHSHIFTVGKSVASEIPITVNGVPVIRIERGGQWTYHGPGQLVGYPILDLDARERNIHHFLWSIEETIILTLNEFGIKAERVEGKGKTGVWVGKRKIASIGAAVRNWVTFHGFALNVNTDMQYFSMIEPCGMPSSTITSMKECLNRGVDLNKVKESISHRFEEVFQLKLALQELPA
ncbi:MAG TPA: lipoyl(octanoyl) transferase LipB [Methylomirabilota bacterium]|nr:lipoyl(octanoyl) transferase LipB [Methylomirabilota bacterium]